MVGRLDRRPEDRHQLVADVGCQRAVVGEHERGHLFVVLAQHIDDLARRVAIRVAREDDQIAEQHREGPLLSPKCALLGIVQHLLDHVGRHILLEGCLDPPALAFFGQVAINGQYRVGPREGQGRVHHVEPHVRVHEKLIGDADEEPEERHDEHQPAEGAHPRQCGHDEQWQDNDGQQVEDPGPARSGDEIRGQDIVDDRGVVFQARRHGPERRAADVADPDRRRSHQHDLVLERAARQLAPENVADGVVGKGLLGAQVIDQHLPGLVGADEAIPDLDPFDAIGPRADRELRLAHEMPIAQDRQGWEQVLSALDHQRHPSHDTVGIDGHAEVAGRRRGGREHVEIALRRVGLQEGHRGSARVRVDDERVLGVRDAAELPLDAPLVEFVPDLRLAHMEEVAEHDRGRRSLECAPARDRCRRPAGSPGGSRRAAEP